MIPLPTINESSLNTLNGMIYIYTLDINEQNIDYALCHYGIRYDLHFSDNKIQPKSELWMGSLLEADHIYYTPKGKLPISEWHDFRPLPVIPSNVDQS